MEHKGLWQRVKEMPVHTFEYNPEKFWNENTIESIFKDLKKIDDDRKEWERKTNWKPDYMISVGEAKTANLGWLKWLSENYRLMGGSKAVQTIRQREIIVNFKINP